MVMWCLSGAVMMYVSYPNLAKETRLRHLAPIDWNECCKISAAALNDDATVGEAEVEMLGSRPILRRRGQAGLQLIDLNTGSSIDQVSRLDAVSVAKAFATKATPASPLNPVLIDYDQWTVSGSFNADRPLYRHQLRDGVELYVSSRTGRAVQMTSTGQRFWNWVGAIPHWLYFAELRHKPSLWNEVVIATSLAGCFLVAIGIYIGIRRLNAGPIGRWSPYGGFNLWHHLLGLIFGIFALTWVLSGLLSMNPWGWLQGADAEAEIAQLRGDPAPSAARIKKGLSAFARTNRADVVSLEISPLNGNMYFIASTARGERIRFSVDAELAPLNDEDLAQAARALGDGGAPAMSLMTQEDAYYFTHHGDIARLPAYRMIVPDGTRYYLDAVSGALVAKIDRGAGEYRWLHEGLHRLDFAAWLRARPLWDLTMLALISGVTLLCATGVYAGYRRLVRREPAAKAS